MLYNTKVQGLMLYIPFGIFMLSGLYGIFFYGHEKPHYLNVIFLTALSVLVINFIILTIALIKYNRKHG